MQLRLLALCVVQMEIPGSGVINRYVAAQGPLAETSHDFWAMVWHERSSLVVMLTTVVERGRVKCHQYWPDVDDTLQFDRLAVTCVSETTSDNASYILRNFTLTHDDVRTTAAAAAAAAVLLFFRCDKKVGICREELVSRLHSSPLYIYPHKRRHSR